MTIGLISSTSTKSLMLLQVDMDAALSKYQGVAGGDEVAAKALSESTIAQRMVSRGGRNVEDKDSIVDEISGGCGSGEDDQWPRYCMKHSWLA
jgi:hypothetical protein